MNERHYHKGLIALDRPELVAEVKSALSTKRFEHCLRVEETAVKLAEQYGEDMERASIAALLHDYAKEATVEELKQYTNHPDYDADWLRYGNAIWHGPLAAMKAQRTLGLVDDEIYWAVYWHTVGSLNWTPTAKLVSISDFIEPNRQFPEVIEARQRANQSLDEAITYKMQQELQFLIQKGQVVYPKAITVYNHWMNTHQGEL
ncbi:MAG: bis(5'-nucleosyl)-tetraphosphatase (symmetrical) YqeK [Aerococcus sp.]|nr:bis(5'-nucleosyl)-tetraphosphatase (symmetrical) YqeK [Aerococcus sp.]